jgi:hypothetical protein
VKKIFQLIALIILLTIGGGATFAIAFPGDAKAHLRTGARALLAPSKSEAKKSEPVARHVASATKAPTADDGDKQGNNKPTASGPPPRGTAPKSGAAPPRRPPTRSEIEARARLEAVRGKEVVEPTRRALMLGPSPDPITSDPPPPSLYPFKVERRLFPTSDMIRIEMSIKNGSGIFWSTAYIAMRSQDSSKTIVFRIDDWRIDEVIGLDYTFPKDELESRLAGLRVARVSGIKRESALSEIVGDARASFAGGKTSAEAARNRTNSSSPEDQTTFASVKVPGLLGMINSVRAPLIGMKVEVTSSDAAMTSQVPLALPMELMLPEKIDVGLLADTPMRSKAVVHFDTAVAEARKVQASLSELIGVLSTKPYGEAKKDEIPAIRSRIQASLDAYNKESINLAVLSKSARDPKISEAETMLAGVADRVVKQVGSLEKQIRRVDPKFELMPK